MLVEEPLPLVNTMPWSLEGLAVVPCVNLINESVTVKFVVSIVVVVPLTVKSPVTVRLSATVVSDVLCPIVIAVPEIPVPIDTLSLEFAVSTIK